MARAKHISAFPHTYWQLLETVLRRGSFTFEHPAADVKRLVDDLYSFQMTLRKERHADARRFSYVQVWPERAEGSDRRHPKYTGRITLQLRDADPRLEGMKSALAATEEFPEEEITPRADSSGDTAALDRALSRLMGEDTPATASDNQPPTDSEET